MPPVRGDFARTFVHGDVPAERIVERYGDEAGHRRLRRDVPRAVVGSLHPSARVVETLPIRSMRIEFTVIDISLRRRWPCSAGRSLPPQATTSGEAIKLAKRVSVSAQFQHNLDGHKNESPAKVFSDANCQHRFPSERRGGDSNPRYP